MRKQATACLNLMARDMPGGLMDNIDRQAPAAPAQHADVLPSKASHQNTKLRFSLCLLFPLRFKPFAFSACTSPPLSCVVCPLFNVPCGARHVMHLVCVLFLVPYLLTLAHTVRWP